MQVNRTIDDSQLANSVANVTYYNPDPNHGWATETCSTCVVKPDKSMPGVTWHYTRTNLTGGVTPNSFTLTFPGTAIYVYGVAFKHMRFEHGVFAITHLSFTLDDQESSPSDDYYSNGSSNSNAEYEFNILVYSKSGLSNTTHTLEVALARGENSTLFNAFIFDYANYTFEAPSELPPQSSSTIQTTSSTSPTQPAPDPSGHHISAGAIAGITVGVLALASLAIGIVFFFLRRRSRRYELTPGTTTDLTPSHSPQAHSITAALTMKLGRDRALVQSNTSMGTEYNQGEVAALRAEVERLQARNAFYVDALTLPPYDGTRR